MRDKFLAIGTWTILQMQYPRVAYWYEHLTYMTLECRAPDMYGVVSSAVSYYIYYKIRRSSWAWGAERRKHWNTLCRCVQRAGLGAAPAGPLS